MKKFHLFAGVALLALLSACGTASNGGEIVMDEPVPAGAENLMVVELEFTMDEIIPNTVTLPANTEVLFVITNTDSELAEDHNLVAPEIGLNEMIVVAGQTIRRTWTTFSEAGEYRAGCTIHPWIDMTIVIE